MRRQGVNQRERKLPFIEILAKTLFLSILFYRVIGQSLSILAIALWTRLTSSVRFL